jgi:aryl carrier-like protein
MANLHAAVFHDGQDFPIIHPKSNNFNAGIDSIPHAELVEKYRNSHFSTVFLWNCIVRPEFYFWQEMIELG